MTDLKQRVVREFDRDIEVFPNPRIGPLRQEIPIDEERRREVLDFHRSLSGYSETPLAKLSALANEMGVARIYVKDESFRFGLNSFKALGASFAVHKAVSTESSLVTATDGNHGRAVAWSADRLGLKSVIFMPEGADTTRVKKIAGHGAKVSVGGINYEAAVEFAKEYALHPGRILIQDTAWPGYEEIPELITQGYATLVSESVSQMRGEWPTHVLLQAGVGSLAAGVISAFLSIGRERTPKFIIAEPAGAACVYESAISGELVTIEGRHETIMACLSCGRASSTAWDILDKSATAFIKCPDRVTVEGMSILENPLGQDPAVMSGESGSLTTGLLSRLMKSPVLEKEKKDLDLGSQSIVLLFSTEGRLGF